MTPKQRFLAAVENKAVRGRQIGLMGNLHTTTVMLRGSVTDVRRESLKAMFAAGPGGGFVLSTGDQCGCETPDENIRAMVKKAKEFGHYPLQLDTIADEIHRLEHQQPQPDRERPTR